MVGVWGGRRRQALVAVLLLSLAGLGALQVATAARHRQVRQPNLILRLSDLQPGYLTLDLVEEQGDRIFCSRLSHPRDTPPKLARFVIRFRPRGCAAAYFRVFVVPGQAAGPVVAGTGVLSLKSDKAVKAAWGVVPQLLGRLLKDHPPRQVSSPATVGSATKLFHTNRRLDFYPLFGRVGGKASFLVWRSGNTLAVVMTLGESFAEIDPQAVRLARRQQIHIRKPTRYTRAEKFDGEVALDDPSLETPAYWLGRNFKPGRGLPRNRLFASFPLDGSEEEVPGALLGIWYGQIRLYTWTQETWTQYAGTPEAHAIASWHCTKKKTIELPGGFATIYGGYKKNYRRCPGESPNAFTARVYTGNLVIAVNPIEVEPPDPPGLPPSGPFIETVNPYGSFKGMEAIVRNLHLRPKPVY